jgi:hypothetical protein
VYNTCICETIKTKPKTYNHSSFRYNLVVEGELLSTVLTHRQFLNSSIYKEREAKNCVTYKRLMDGYMSVKGWAFKYMSHYPFTQFLL